MHTGVVPKFFEVAGGQYAPTATSQHLHSWSTARTCFLLPQHSHYSSLTVLLPSQASRSSGFQSSIELEQCCHSRPPRLHSLADCTLRHLPHTESCGAHSTPGQHKLHCRAVGWCGQVELAIVQPECQKHFRRCAWKKYTSRINKRLFKCCQSL